MDEGEKLGGKKDSNEGKGSDESKKDIENKLSDPNSTDERKTKDSEVPETEDGNPATGSSGAGADQDHVETKNKGWSAKLQNITFAGLVTKPKGTGAGLAEIRREEKRRKGSVASPEKEKHPVASAQPQPQSDPNASRLEGSTPTAPLTTAGESGMNTPPERPPDSTQKLQRVHDKLKVAVTRGKNTEVKRMLEKEEGLVNNQIGSDKGTVVHYIIRHGHGDKGTEKERLEQLRLLVSKSIPQVDWSATDKWGKTPLHLACAHGRNYGEIAEFLLQRGANPNVLDSNETAPLLDAAAENHKDIILILLQCDRTNICFTGPNLRTALHKAAWRGHVDIADVLLNHDPSMVYLEEKDGYTPLHDACRQDKPEMVEKLILAEANVTARTNGRSTPLHLAAQSNALAAAKVLLRAGASTTARNGANETPADVAHRKGNNEMLELLRAPPKVENRLALIGARLQVSLPTPPQQEASKAFGGFVWPSIDRDTGFDNLTVFEMLYGDNPRLKKSRLGKGVKVRWIHIPSNNQTWLKDAFKVVYSQSGLTEARVQPKDKSERERFSLSERERFTALQGILRFIRTESFESKKTLYRPPQFKITSYSKRPGNPKPRLFSLVLPVLDVDIQQPAYYNPNGEPLNPAPESKRDPEMDADSTQLKHARKLKNLKQAYPMALNKCRSLDEYNHEFIENNDLRFRNGDQVVSYFIERIRRDTSKAEQPSAQPEVVHQRQNMASDGLRRRIRSGSLGYPETENNNQAASFGASGSEVLEGGNSVVAEAEANWEKNRSITPSQLESQNKTPRPLTRGAFLARWQRVRDLVNGNALRPDCPPPASPKTDALDILGADEKDKSDGKNNGSLPDPNNDQVKEQELQESLLQQILTVPQLWLWAVDDTVVTCFPENWRVSDSGFPQFLRDEVLEHQTTNGGKPTVDRLIRDIVTASMEYEPSLTALNGYRSYLEVFAAEIASVSREVTTCYESFKSGLGTTMKKFPDAVRKETNLLVRIDDIVGEIAMIKRVLQDQDYVCVSMRAKEGPDKGSYTTSPTGGKDGSGRDGNQKDGSGVMSREKTAPIVNFQHDWAMEKGRNDMRSPRSQHVISRLERLDEDANRVRKSIITLLDLLQRQATTENAIESSKQSELLTVQSRVLFVFTIVTVIFAPLSWVSSLMALNIDHFSPGKDSPWFRGDMLAASFGSVLSTLVACVILWICYDKWYRRMLKKKEEMEERERKEN